MILLPSNSHVILSSFYCPTKLAVCEVKPCPWPEIWQAYRKKLLAVLWQVNFCYLKTRLIWKLVNLFDLKPCLFTSRTSLELKEFDCFAYEMPFIYELRPTLNVQSDSICAKVFPSFFFACFHYPFTPTKPFILMCIYIYICILILLFYHSLDNDRTTFKTTCFTVGFYR